MLILTYIHLGMGLDIHVSAHISVLDTYTCLGIYMYLNILSRGVPLRR